MATKKNIIVVQSDIQSEKLFKIEQVKAGRRFNSLLLASLHINLPYILGKTQLQVSKSM